MKTALFISVINQTKPKQKQQSNMTLTEKLEQQQQKTSREKTGIQLSSQLIVCSHGNDLIGVLVEKLSRKSNLKNKA